MFVCTRNRIYLDLFKIVKWSGALHRIRLQYKVKYWGQWNHYNNVINLSAPALIGYIG